MGIKISVVMPAYNEAKAIARTVSGTQQVMDALNVPYEIIIVDDGSTDGTPGIIESLGTTIVRHPYNKGNGAAIKTGIRAARGETLVMMDADGQHDPADIERLIAPIGEYDMIVGARDRGSQQWHRQLANSAYNAFTSYLTGFRIQDLTSGFRAIKRKLALQFCYLLPNTFSYPTTLTIAVIRAGYSLKYVDIKAAPRLGHSKIKLLRDGLRFLVIMVRIATLFSPLKVFVPIGLALFSPGFVYAIYKLTIHRPWTIPITISISTGTLVVVLGLLAEEIATLRMQQIDRQE